MSDWYEPADPEPREVCPCCDHVTLAERGYCLICPVCFWEDDSFIGDQLHEPSMCNHGLTLAKARETFAAIGACAPAMLPHVVPVSERARFARRPPR